MKKFTAPLHPLAFAVAALAWLTPAVGAEVDAPRAAWAAQDAAAAMTDRLIVKYRNEGLSLAAQSRSATALQLAGNRHGVALIGLRRMGSGAQVFQVSRALPQSQMQTLAESLRAADSNIEYAEPDRILQPAFVPNDALYGQQWHLSDATGGIRAPAAWDKSRGLGVTVAVIDTGIRPHADLRANLLPGYDFISNTTIANDGSGRDADAADPGDWAAAGACGSGSRASNSSWHGTHVAGIVAAAGHNATGVAGVAFAAKVLPLRALGRCGGYTSDIADAMVWAVGGSVAGLPANPNVAKVLNLSLGGSGSCDTTTQNAINAARARGAVVVVAAGNSNKDAAGSSPANCSGVITVAATARSGGKASYSNFGARVTLAAPGGDTSGGVLSTLNAGTTTPGADNYVAYMGTSMATPVVSGVAALMLAVNKTLTPDQVSSLLKSSARAFPAPCPQCGVGIVDAAAAVQRASAAPVPAPPPPAPPPPPPAPAPAPTPGTVAELEPNNTLAQAQKLASLPVVVNGSMASTADVDHYQFTLPAGKRLVTTLTQPAGSAFALALLNSTGQQLGVVSGPAGSTVQLTVSNAAATAVVLHWKISRTSGAAGAYKLTMNY